MRMDIQGSNGSTPARPSASTQATATSSSSASKMMTSSSSNTLTDHTYGDEVEVHSLLVLDQHTFEGEISKDIKNHLNGRYVELIDSNSWFVKRCVISTVILFSSSCSYTNAE